MKIFALTFGGPDCASTQYRLLQFLPQMRDIGVVMDHCPAKEFTEFEKLSGYDVVILQKTLLSSRLVGKIRRHARRLVYDADDLIWTRPGKQYGWFTRFKLSRRLGAIMEQSDVCIAANQVISADMQGAGAREVVVVPMALDGSKWKPENRAPGARPLTVGWSGSPANLPFIEAVGPHLRNVQAAFPEVRFLIHCGRKPSLPGVRFDHVPFEPGNEPATVAAFDIGLFPLPEGEFVRGKSPIKILQYFACGVASVGNPVGASRDFVQDRVNSVHITESCSWAEALGMLLKDETLRQKIAAEGRKKFVAEYDATAVFRRLMDVLTTKKP